MRDDWIEHRRGLDGELIGWMRPDGDGFVVIDLLGRDRTGVLDWFDAEAALDDLGIGYLADIYELRSDEPAAVDGWLRVRIAEVSPVRVRVKQDDGGAVGAPQIYYDLPFPAPESLRVRVR